MGETRPVLDIASLLVTAAVPRLVDALVSGRGVGSDDAGGVAASAVEELLGTVLKAQDQTAETLARLEQKIDRVTVRPYRTAMEVGYRNLSEAQPTYRTPGDRSRLLDQAVQQFFTASAAAADTNAPPEAAVEAELLLASCYLAKRSPQDFYATTARAADRAFKAALDANRDFLSPGDAERARRPWGSVPRRVEWILAPEKQIQKFEKAQLEALTVLTNRAELFNRVQEVRRRYRADRPDRPRLLGFFDSDLNDHLASRLQPSFFQSFPGLELPARIEGISARIVDSDLRFTRLKGNWFMADAAIEASASPGTVVQARATAATADLTTRIRPSEAELTRAKAIEFLPSQEKLPLWDGTPIDARDLPDRVALRCFDFIGRERVRFGLDLGALAAEVAAPTHLVLIFGSPGTSPVPQPSIIFKGRARVRRRVVVRKRPLRE